MKMLAPLFVCVCAIAEDKPAYTFGTTAVSSSGFQGHIYHLKEQTQTLPKLEKMKPAGTIYTNALNVWPQHFDEGFPGITERFEWFGIDYRSKLWIEKPGQYRFSLLSDDGAKLTIGKELIIDNDGNHGAGAVTGSALLTRGVHEIRVSYFQGPRFTVALVLAVAPPGEAWRILNTDEFKPPKNPEEWIAGKVEDIRSGTNRLRER